MKKTAKVLTILLAVWMLLSATGCNMIQVDTEKDMERVVIQMGDEEILKADFNSYLTYHALVYEVNGYSLPEGDSLDVMKEDILDTMVEIQVLKKQALEQELEVDMADLEEETDDLLATFTEALEEDDYLNLLAEYNMTQETFEAFLLQYMEDVRYANAAIASFTEDLQADASEELGKTIMVLNGETILKEELYYQLSTLEFEYYLGTGSGLPTDEESLAYIHEEILDDITESRLMSALALEEGLSADESEIEEMAVSMKANFTTYFDEDSLETYLNDYYLTLERYEALLMEDARRAVLMEKYENSLEAGITVTSEEIQEYYDENKDNYDTDTVSAKHILTDSEEYANELMASITDAASFETVFEQVQDDEQVTEATDLGAFSYDQMVEEFSEEAFSLEPGQVSDAPVESQYGYHIVYVYDKHEAVIPSLEEKTDEIRAGLMASKAVDKYAEVLAQELDDADIETEEIQEPYLVYLDELLELYQVKTYPSRL